MYVFWIIRHSFNKPHFTVWKQLQTKYCHRLMIHLGEMIERATWHSYRSQAFTVPFTSMPCFCLCGCVCVCVGFWDHPNANTHSNNLAIWKWFILTHPFHSIFVQAWIVNIVFINSTPKSISRWFLLDFPHFIFRLYIMYIVVKVANQTENTVNSWTINTATSIEHAMRAHHLPAKKGSVYTWMHCTPNRYMQCEHKNTLTIQGLNFGRADIW